MMTARLFIYTLFTCFFMLPACSPKAQNQTDKPTGYRVINFKGRTQGTSYNISYVSDTPLVCQHQIDSLLHAFDLSLSSYDSSSIISKINGNQAIEVDTLFSRVFHRAQAIALETNGLFDITVGPLVDAWGFGVDGPQDVDQALIDSLKEITGYEKVRLDKQRILKDDPRIRLDVNALAQGYAVDVMSEYLESHGLENYLVEIGGEVRASGYKPGRQLWRIGIDRPIDDPENKDKILQEVVSLTNKSLATSGNYRRYYIKDGQKYSHTINPQTGYPVAHKLLSATVVADNCLDADAYATSLMVMGIDKAKLFLDHHPELLAYLIYSKPDGGFEVFYTPALLPYLATPKQ